METYLGIARSRLMPIFRFEVVDGTNIPQPEPHEFASKHEAMSHAVLLAGQMLKDIDGKFWQNSHWTIQVTDLNGLVIAKIDIDGSLAPAAL
jgi:hypothetical protein